MIRINLIPKEYIDRQLKRKMLSYIISSSIWLIIAVIIFTGRLVLKARNIESELQIKEARLKVLKSTVDKVKELEANKAAVKAHVDTINNLLDSRFYYVNFMQDFAKTLSADVWFRSINTKSDETGKIKFNVIGISKTVEEIAKWYSILENNNRFEDPNLGTVTVSGSGADVSYSFPLDSFYFMPLTKEEEAKK
jgi:Tfp pilus assembly protein PilN